jgi:hypothetical protein
MKQQLKLWSCFVWRNWPCHLFFTYTFYFTCDKIYLRSSTLIPVGWHLALRVASAIGLCWLTGTWPGSQGKNKVGVFVANSQLSSGRVAKNTGKVQSALQCIRFPLAFFASWNSTRSPKLLHLCTTLHGVTSQKTLIFMVPAMRTS